MPDTAPLGGVDLSASQIAERARWRQSTPARDDGPLYPVEQEFSLELPLGYTPAPPAVPPRIAVLLHAFHIDLLPEFRAYLDHIPFPADLFVTTDEPAKDRAAAACFANWPQGNVETRIVPNRGRDVAPKLAGLADIHDRYEYILHLHTKRSAHDSRLAGWRGYILETLLGSPETIRGVFEAFAQSPRLGLLAPQHADELRPWVRWSANFDQAEALATRMGFCLPRRAPLDFPSGSMFWARSAALRPLLDLHLEACDFPEETGQTDGTLAHAIERLIFLVCEQAGLDWMKIAARGQLHEQRGVVAVTDPRALRTFLARRRLSLAALRDERREIEDAPIITTPTPAPRRVPHVLWRRVLGDEMAPRPGRLIVALPPDNGVSNRLAASVGLAFGNLPPGITGETVTVLAGPPGESDGTWRNRALRAGFAAGADLVLLVDAPGLLHPHAAAALIRMSQAQDGRAVLEAARFPQAAPGPVDVQDFAISRAAGPALAVPRAVWDETGGFDERLAGPDAELDFARRARAAGLDVKHCPRALYLAGDVAAAHVDPAGIDVIVRLYDTSELPRLGQCVFSLLGQSLPLRVRVMLQRFSFTELGQARAAIASLAPLDEVFRVTLHNWQYPEPLDLRVPLLNWGLELAEARYVTCIGVSDVLFPGALPRLLTRLRATRAAIAIGGMTTQPVRWWGDVILPLASGGEPAGPLFLLDRNRLPPRDLAFRSGQADGEIAEFIDRAANVADRACMNDLLGLRQIAD